MKLAMHVRLKPVVLTTTAAMVLGGLSVPSQAQQPDSVREGGLEVVTVTARKREESLQNVPVAITAISEKQINRYDLTSLEKLAAMTPQLVIGRGASGSGAQITMRGVGGQSTSIAIETSTAVVVDGVYYGQGLFLNEALFDLQGIEVLKGPQALFFGKNATAGVISVKTAEPTDTFESMVRASYEIEAENVIGEAFASGPLRENLTGRIAVRMSNMYGGYFTNRAEPTTINYLDVATGDTTPRVMLPNSGDQPGTDEKIARLTLKWTPTDRLTATLRASAMRSEEESNGWNFVPFGCPNGVTQANPEVPCRRDFNIYMDNAPQGITGSVPFMRADGAPFNDYKSHSITADIDYQLTDEIKLTSITNYNKHRNTWGLSGDYVNSPNSFIAATQDTSFWAFSNETRLQTSFDGPLNVMVGAYYQLSERDHFQAGAFAPLQDSSLPPHQEFLAYSKPSETEGDTISGFGQVTWMATEQVELAAGVRYTHETKDSFLVQDYVMPALQGVFPENEYIYGDQSFEEWSPEATITYHPSDNVTLYGAYKTAYKSGGFSNSALVVPATSPDKIMFEPETAEGFEVGLKSILFGNQVRVGATAYIYDYEDLQVDFLDAVTFEYITTNAGSSRVEGVELEAMYAPNGIRGLELHGTLNYNKARYEEFIAPCYAGQSIAAGCNTTFMGGFGQDLSGFPSAVAPEWTASLGGSYERPLANDFNLGLSVDAAYSDGYLGSNFGHPLSRQKSYISLDASLRMSTADDKWELALIGRNLTNEFIIGGTIDMPFSGSGVGTAAAIPADQAGLVNLPRTVRLQLTWRH